MRPGLAQRRVAVFLPTGVFCGPLLAKVGLTHRVDAYPSQLSGGEQQRAAIARALAVHPSVILFDEPTSALDPELVGEVLSVIQGLAAEGRTMIIVTHEMAFARDVSSRTLFLCEGRIEEEGTSSALFNSPCSPRLEQFLESPSCQCQLPRQAHMQELSQKEKCQLVRF